MTSLTSEPKKQGMTNEQKMHSARRRLGMTRKPIKCDGTIVEHADMLWDLSDLCWAAGLFEMAEVAERLWENSMLWYREELVEAEARWT